MMLSKKKHVLRFLSGGLVLALGITGCSGTKTNETSTPKETPAVTNAVEKVEPKKDVKLKWIIYGEEKEDSKLVWAEFNKKLQEKLPGVQVEIQPIESAAYDDKSRLIVASGEDYDIMWAASWKGDAVGKVGGGAFLDIDSIIREHAPELLEAIPQYDWDKVTYGGKIMGVPSHQTVINGKAIKMPLETYERYKNIIPEQETVSYAKDYTKSSADILRLYEPFLEQAKKDGANKNLALVGPGGLDLLAKNYEVFLGLKTMPLLGVSLNTRERKVINLLESKDFKDYIVLMSEWSTKGYFPTDVAAVKNLPPTEVYALLAEANYDLDLPTRNQRVTDFFGRPMKTIMVAAPSNQGSGAASSSNFISTKSKNPVEAVQLLALINTDAELYNLLAYGIEGQHFEMKDNTMVALKETYGIRDWVLGNTDVSYKLAADKEYLELVTNIFAAEPQSIIPGFIFNMDDVKTQFASVEAINSEYLDAFIYGLKSDPMKMYEEYIAELKNAGMDAIVQEAQRQMDEWAKTSK